MKVLQLIESLERDEQQRALINLASVQRAMGHDVRIVPRDTFPPRERERLVRKIAERMRTEIEIGISEVPAIPMTASGKRRVTVSNIP